MYHTCALTAAGEAYCWGLNTHGQLGRSTPERALSPVAVAGGVRFVAISSGTSHTCAVTAAGAAYCWGLNHLGQLGDGTISSSMEPVAVAGGRVFDAISTGTAHTCALTRSGEAYCWGANDHGETGGGGIGRPGLPGNLTPARVGGGARFRAVVAGASHSCGVGTDGKAYCWGRGTFGELGNGNTTDWAMPQWVGDGYAMVSAGRGTHVCATRTDATLYCWGTGEFGQLGALTTTFTTVPVRVGRRR
jgi:alpha-tubulin suppressor-like RCC1 family protein